jgi:hypothetical protein
MEEQKEQIEKNQIDVSKANTRCDELSVKIGESDATIQNLHSELAQKDTVIEEHLVTIAQLQTSGTDTTNKYEETYERLRAEQAKVVVLQRQLLEMKAEFEVEVEKHRVEAAAMRAVAEDIRDKYTVMKATLDAKIEEQAQTIASLEEAVIAAEAEQVRLVEETRREMEQDKENALGKLQEELNMSRQELEDRLSEDMRVLRETMECQSSGSRLSMATLQGVRGDKDAMKRLIVTMTQLQQSYKDIDELSGKHAQLQQALRVYKAQVASQSQALAQQSGQISSLQQQLGHDGGITAVEYTHTPQQVPMTPSKPSAAPATPSHGPMSTPSHGPMSTPSHGPMSTPAHGAAPATPSASTSTATDERLVQENALLKEKLKHLASVSAKEVERLRNELTAARGGSSRAPSTPSTPAVKAAPAPAPATPSHSSRTTTPVATRVPREKEPSTPMSSARPRGVEDAPSSASSSRSNSRVRDRSATPRVTGNVSGYGTASGTAATNVQLEAMHNDRKCTCYATTNASRCAFAIILSQRKKQTSV